jgi:23S rRNA pseudouridine1911/1915/1917 synthase
MKSIKSKLEILYEDGDILAVNKPSGILVGEGRIDDDAGEKGRLGIVHRLDKDTSGVLLVARTKDAHRYLVKQFKSRKVRKHYTALVLGKPKHPEGIIDSPIGRAHTDRQKMALSYEDDGKNAISHYKVAKSYNVGGKYVFSLVNVEIMTGRTHQIRVHMAAIGNPVLGDEKYGNRKANKYCADKFDLKRQFLHAKVIEFVLPSKKKVVVKSDLPKDLEDVLEKI